MYIVLFIEFTFACMIIIERYKKATIRKRSNQKKIPTPKTEAGKNQTSNKVLITKNNSLFMKFMKYF